MTDLDSEKLFRQWWQESFPNCSPSKATIQSHSSFLVWALGQIGGQNHLPDEVYQAQESSN